MEACMSQRAVEKYYSVEEAMFLLGYTCSKTIIRKIKAGDFGSDVVDLGENQPDYRIPASGLNAFLDRRRLFSESDSSNTDMGISARTIGELRRKVSKQS